MSDGYPGLSHSYVNTEGSPLPNGTYPTVFYMDLPSLNPYAVFDYVDGDTPIYHSVNGAYNGIGYFIDHLNNQLNDSELWTDGIDLNYERDWYQTIQSVKTINGYNYGIAQYKDYSGSVVTLTSNATGQYLNGSDFDFNVAGTSTLYTSINYIGKNDGKIEESLVGKESESYVATIGQKANADGMLIGLNTYQGTYANNYVYKDGIDTSDKSDNVTITATNRLVTTNSINTTAASDILSEGTKKDSSASSSYGAGSNNSYTQKNTESSATTASQTFNADSSIAESYKTNQILTSTFTNLEKYSQSDINSSGGTLNATTAAAGFKTTGTHKYTDTVDYASSVNVDGNFKDASTETEKYEEAFSATGFDVFSDAGPTLYHNYSNTLSFTSTTEAKDLRDEQKAISEYTNSYKNVVALTYAGKDLTSGVTESLAVGATVNFKQSNFDDNKNNVYTQSSEITKLTHTVTQTVGATTTQLGDSLDLAAKAIFTAGTDSAGLELAPTLAITFTTGKYSEFNDVSSAVDYEITTAASTNTINFATTNLSGDETSNINYTLQRVADYLDQTESGSLRYGFEDYQSDFVDYILLGNNTITIKSLTGVEIDAGLGNDTITGGAGSDFIAGGRGADTIDGKGGSDTYFIDGNSGSALGKTGAVAFTGFDVITLDGSDTINYSAMGSEYNASKSGADNLTSANFTSADKAAAFLNAYSLDAGDVIWVTDSTTTGVATKGAIYYYAGDVDATSGMSAGDIALIGVTTGTMTFGTSAPIIL